MRTRPLPDSLLPSRNLAIPQKLSMRCCWPKAWPSGSGQTAAWRRGSWLASAPRLRSAWQTRESASCASWQRWSRAAWKRWLNGVTHLVSPSPGPGSVIYYAAGRTAGRPSCQRGCCWTGQDSNPCTRSTLILPCCRQRGARCAGPVPAASHQPAVLAGGVAAWRPCGAGGHRWAAADRVRKRGRFHLTFFISDHDWWTCFGRRHL